MTDTPLAIQSQSGLAALVRRANALMTAIPYALVALVARVSIGAVFWRSGQTKLEGWHLSDSAILLFKDEYRLPVIDPTLAAYLATIAEHVFPILLILGLATRFSALALLIMTLVIEIFVYPDAWPTHGTWAACFLILMTHGAGKLSFDYWITQLCRRD